MIGTIEKNAEGKKADNAPTRCAIFDPVHLLLINV